MYYECFCSESFLIYSMMRFEANNIRKGKTEVVNLVHSYGRWEIRPREVKPTFPQAQKVLCQSHHQSPESLSLSPDFTVPPVILMLSYWHIFFYFSILKQARPRDQEVTFAIWIYSFTQLHIGKQLLPHRNSMIISGKVSGL